MGDDNSTAKSALEKKLQDMQLHAVHISVLEQLRAKLQDAQVHQGSEHFKWYGPYFESGIGAGILALTALIDSDAADAQELLRGEAAEAQDLTHA